MTAVASWSYVALIFAWIICLPFIHCLSFNCHLIIAMVKRKAAAAAFNGLATRLPSPYERAAATAGRLLIMGWGSDRLDHERRGFSLHLDEKRDI